MTSVHLAIRGDPCIAPALGCIPAHRMRRGLVSSGTGLGGRAAVTLRGYNEIFLLLPHFTPNTKLSWSSAVSELWLVLGFSLLRLHVGRIDTRGGKRYVSLQMQRTRRAIQFLARILYDYFFPAGL
jgi:hypothetical protein